MKTKGVAPAKLKKVEEAENLAKVENPPASVEERDALAERVNKAIKIYKDLCFTSTITPNDKIEVIVSFLKHVPDEGREALIRMRDLLSFCRGKEQENLLKLLVLICKNPEIDAHERSITATTLYNQAFLHVCFQCFEAIALDQNVKPDYRVEACRQLFCSGEPQNKETAQECLIEVLGNLSLTSEYRYKQITGFISKTGVATRLNMGKIKVPYEEEFVYGLQSCFFYENQNGVRERILSGQHMLGMKCVKSKEKDKIVSKLLEFSKDENYDENTRADAADVVLRMGTPEQISLAREIITSLGYSALGKKEGIINHIKTVYTNSQNIHDENISECITKFIEKIIASSSTREEVDFEKVRDDIMALLKSRLALSTEADKEKAFKKHRALAALNRVSIDTATFTKYNVSTLEILIHVWKRIQTFNKEKQMLENRLIEELVEMGDTCSSGHAGRFVNVLSAVDAELRISYESQIAANLAGRLNARIRDIEDADLRASISLGMLPDAEEADVVEFKKFISSSLESLRVELYDEFVGGRYVTAAEFTKYFNKATEQFS